MASNIFYFYQGPWGRWTHFYYFSKGLKPPTSCKRSTKLSNIKCGHVSFLGGFWSVFFGVFFSEKMARVVWYSFFGLQKNKGRIPVTRWDAPFTLIDPLTVTTMAANVRNVEVQRKTKSKREGGVIKGDWKVDIPRYTTFMGCCPEISMVMSRFSSPPKNGLIRLSWRLFFT